MTHGTITTNELADAIGVSWQRVASWIRRGLPVASHNGRYRFDPAAVENWLLAEGLIATAASGATEPGVLRNRTEVARHYGVNEDTVSAWHRRDGFPGRRATPEGHTDGYYRTDEIDAWLATRAPHAHGGGSVESERAKLISIQCRERELRLQKAQGELIEVETVKAFMARMINQAGALIDELPDRVMSHLQADLSTELRECVRGDMTGVAADLRTLLGELAAGDADEETS